MSAKHTPGPWKFDPSTWYGYCALWNPETRQEVLVTGGRNDGDDPITWMGEDLSDADRALIEAAPDLLEALTDLMELVHHANPGAFSNGVSDSTGSIDEGDVIASRIIRKALVAIAKATGAPE